MAAVRLKQKITLWSVISHGKFGDTSYSEPLVVKARWIHLQEKFTNENGDISISKFVFYTKSEIEPINTYVYLGESSEATPPKEAKQVAAFSDNPESTDLKKGWVSK